MSEDDIHQGPLTHAQLSDLWTSVVDKNYSGPIKAAGDGNGLEVYGQAFEQFQRVSNAIDRTTQSMYIRPYSGQTNPSATGEAKATVQLTFRRSKLINRALVLPVGFTYVEEETTDWGTEGPETVRTGRKYVLTEAAVFHAGDVGPVVVSAEAERTGYGYNNPLPDTLKFIPQVGSDFTNDLAILTVENPALSPAPAYMRRYLLNAANEADTFYPDHIGQTIQITTGANVGKIGRVVEYVPPDVTAIPPSGGKVRLAEVFTLFSSNVSDTFIVGELVSIADGGANIVAYGRIVARSITPTKRRKVTVEVISKPVDADAMVDMLGLTSGVTAPMATAGDSILDHNTMVDDTPVTWRVLDWVLDWGLTVTNEASPEGGRLGMLDELGLERSIPRGSGEGDESYLERVGTVADVVSPNAILRIANRILSPLGIPFSFREVGSASMPGIFYDAGSSSDAVQVPANNYAYDMDPTARPADAWKTYFNLMEFRAFFVIGFPLLGLGEFGFVYDGVIGDPNAVFNYYDAEGPTGLSFDGYARIAAQLARTLYGAIDDARAGGVLVDFVRDEEL